jgi:hypothetical protein
MCGSGVEVTHVTATKRQWSVTGRTHDGFHLVARTNRCGIHGGRQSAAAWAALVRAPAKHVAEHLRATPAVTFEPFARA